jgi:uncharacterized protein YjbI with pentapeptide repeats
VVDPDPPDLPPEPEAPDLAASRWVEAQVEGLSLSDERRPGWALLDCELRDCDLANLDARGAEFRRVAIAVGRLTGFNLAESALRDVVFEDCRADLAVFAQTTLETVRFTSCNLAQATFQEAKLKSVAFEDCDLRGADLTSARFEDVELKNCKLDGIRGANRLHGVRMPWSDIVENAGLFAGACGVDVL